MTTTTVTSAGDPLIAAPYGDWERHARTTSSSAVSWGAIIAGAAAAAALSLILLILGAGLGLSSISPWAQSGISVATLGVSTIVWITLTQLLASGMGGYLAGRLRTRWIGVHTDEVFFRDTAHGLLAWAIATLTTAAVLGSVITSIVGGGVQAGATVAGGAGTAAATGAVALGGARTDANAGMENYFVDALFRREPGAAPVAATTDNNPPADNSATRTGPVDLTPGAPSGEVVRIFAHHRSSTALPADDLRYLAHVVAQRTGLSQADAEKRVADTFARMQTKLSEAETAARDIADKARKASATAALWLFISLLTGAFVASFFATVGGRQRDL